MSEKFFTQEFVPPKEKNLHQFKGLNLKKVIEFLEGADRGESKESAGSVEWEEYLNREGQSIFDGFLSLLRDKGVRVSTSEWLQFIQVLEKKAVASNLKKIIETDELLNKVRLFAQTTLVKDKSEELAFHEAFDEYFELAAKVYSHELQGEMEEKKDEEAQDNESRDSRDSGVELEIKEQLGIDEVDENLDLPEDGDHNDNENVHGGKNDQHNDILKQEDKSKKGGGYEKSDEAETELETEGDEEMKEQSDYSELSEFAKPPKSEQKELSEEGFLVGGGKGKSIVAQRIDQSNITHEGAKLTKQDVEDRERKAGKVDRRKKYEARPDKASMREVIRNLRRIITDVSEVKSGDVDLKRTVKNFARRDFRFNYALEREKQPEVVLLIDVGGPVDEWSPLMKEVAEEMAKGLSKLEVYLFHNNLYGYVWRPNPKDLLASSYAEPNSLIDLKKVVKKRKKVIVYGDAEMSYSEFEGDGWSPSGNDERIAKFGMGGEESLKFIKKKAGSVVWINPVFAKEWRQRDDSGTIKSISEIIPMHDLTVGGVEDAIKELMGRKIKK